MKLYGTTAIYQKNIMHIIFSLSVLDISWYYLEIIQSPLSLSLSLESQGLVILTNI